MSAVLFWSALPTEKSLVYRYMGPYQLGGWLEQHGISSHVIDFIITTFKGKITTDTLVRMTETYITEETKVIGVSSTFLFHSFGQEIPAAYIEAMEILRQKHPGIKFILGGNAVEFYLPQTTSLFDAVVVGLAEDVFIDLIKFYQTGLDEPKFRKPLPHSVKFYYNDDVPNKTFNIQTAEHRWRDRDFIMPGETLPLELSRGCIFKCKFCQYPLLGRDKWDYTRSMDCIRDELVDNYERWGITNYYLLDDTFNDTTLKVEAFANMAARLPFKIQFTGYLRADLLHRFPDTIPMMQEAGLIGCFFGVESFHPQASKIVGKAWSGTHGKEFIEDLFHNQWKKRVNVHVSLIAGLPYETPESLYETRDWLVRAQIPSWYFKALVIFKYNNQIFSSEFSKNAASYGYEHPREDKPHVWVNKQHGWSWPRAKQIELELNGIKSRPEVAENIRIDTWRQMALMTLGVPFDEIITRPYNMLNIDELYRRKVAWVKAYRQRTLLWPNQDTSKWLDEYRAILDSGEPVWLDHMSDQHLSDGDDV